MGGRTAAHGLDRARAGDRAADATRELARRFLHIFGPTTPAAFAKWAGIGAREAVRVFADLDSELIPVVTPSGEAWILASDEPTIREPPAPAAAARLLPSGDAYTLGITSEDRALLVPDAGQRGELWTPRVWPGALLVAGKVVGTWRRSQRTLTIQTWQRLSRTAREAVVAEAESLPLPDAAGGSSSTGRRRGTSSVVVKTACEGPVVGAELLEPDAVDCEHPNVAARWTRAVRKPSAERRARSPMYAPAPISRVPSGASTMTVPSRMT